MTARAVADHLYDPLDTTVIDDPYPTYRRLRDECPVAYLARHDTWVVTRHEDVEHVLRDPRTYSSAVGMAHDFTPAGETATGVNYRFGGPDVRVLIATDPPEHQVFRKVVSGRFTRSSIAGLEPRVTAVARRCVAELVQRSVDGDADFVRDVAEPVPILVLAEFLGVPEHMHEQFREWGRVMTADLDQTGRGSAATGRGMDMFRFFHRRLRSANGDEVLGSVARAREAGVSERELLAFCAFLLAAGVETTTNLLTNFVEALLRLDDLAPRLRRRPEEMERAVEEALRYDTSVQALWRGTTCRTVLRDQVLPAGSRVMVLFASANRDERRFTEPDRFLIDRPDAGHISFGSGPHFCLGARLGRLEIATVMRELLAATDAIRLAGEPVRVHSSVLRGMAHLPVEVTPRAGISERP